MVDRAVAIAEAQWRDLLRRWQVLILLVALPLLFYAALAGHGNQSVAAGAVATAFSIGGASIFTAVSSSSLDRRLIIVGFRPFELLVGRLVVLLLLSIPIALTTTVVMALVTHPDHPVDLFLALGFVALVSVPFGLTVGLAVPHDLEATLVLIGVVGVQLATEPDSRVSRLLPFGEARLVALYSVNREPHAPSPLLVLAYALGLFLACGLLGWLRRRGIRSGAAVASRPS